MIPYYQDEQTTLWHGDCREILATMDENSIDAVVCDPPYGLEFMGKEWDRLGAPDGFRRQNNPSDTGRDNVMGRLSKTAPEYTTGAGRFSLPGIGKRSTKWPSTRGWNEKRCENCGHLSHGGSPCRCNNPLFERADNRWNQMQQWHEQWAREVLRVLKPGGHLLAFGGARTYHRLACAIEDAGFEIRDQIMYIFGSGFPKSLSVHKAVNPDIQSVYGSAVCKCLEESEVGKSDTDRNNSRQVVSCDLGGRRPTIVKVCSWCGMPDKNWLDSLIPLGTALKPAHEPIVIARKPPVGRVVDNVLKYGTGALNIDACRVEPTNERLGGGDENGAPFKKTEGWSRPWMLHPERVKAHAAKVTSNVEKATKLGRWPANIIHDGSDEVLECFPRAPKSVARFFYCAKPSKSERGESNRHPTVKPLALIRYLIRLVTPPSGVVLDPFAGSGTTLLAAMDEGFVSIGIEQSDEYCNMALDRIIERQ